MHKRTKSELLLIDTEIERTLRNLKKVRVAEKPVMVEQEGIDQHISTKPMTRRP